MLEVRAAERFPILSGVLLVGDMASGLYPSCHREAPLVQTLRKMEAEKGFGVSEGQQKPGGAGSSKQTHMVHPLSPIW